MIRTPYQQLGGEAPLRALVDAFYDHMDQSPDYAAIRALHPPDLATSRDKLFWFLSGWLGGPSLYTERFGHPRLRARHLLFPIGIRERDQWLACMRQALSTQAIDAAWSGWFMAQMAQTADWMRNRPECS